MIGKERRGNFLVDYGRPVGVASIVRVGSVESLRVVAVHWVRLGLHHHRVRVVHVVGWVVGRPMRHHRLRNFWNHMRRRPIEGQAERRGAVLVRHHLRVLLHAAFAVALLVTTLLGDHDLLHLLDGHGALHVDPLVLNHVLLLQLQNQIDATDVCIGNESESSRLVGPFVLKNDAVFDLSEIQEVALESAKLQVVRQTADKDLAELSVDFVARRAGLTSQLLQRVELVLVLQNLFACRCVSTRQLVLNRVHELHSSLLDPFLLPVLCEQHHLRDLIRVASLRVRRFLLFCTFLTFIIFAIFARGLITELSCPFPEGAVAFPAALTAPLNIFFLVVEEFVGELGHLRVDVVLFLFRAHLRLLSTFSASFVWVAFFIRLAFI